MILYRILTCVCCGCIYMSYASRQCRSTGATPQSIPNPASALFVTSPSGSTAREGMFPVFPSGVSLSQAGLALKTPVPVNPPKIAFTVKLPSTQIRQLRVYAARTRLTLSDIVSRALTVMLDRGRRRG
jgi:hypothetical protein